MSRSSSAVPRFRRSRRLAAGLCAGLMLMAGCASAGRTPAPEAGEPAYKIVGYVSGSRGLDLRRIDASKLTHINYAFANVRDDRVVLERPQDAAQLAQLNALRAKNPRLKILLSVGGWSWSDHFSDAALTEASRDTFATSAVRLVTAYALDGVDLDWEYPGQPGEDNVYRPEDKQHFTLLLEAVRTHLDARAAQEGRASPYLLTIASGANERYLAHTEMEAAQQYLDFVNIMTYDFHGPWTDSTGHHTNLFRSAGEGVPARAAAEAVEQHIRAGVPPHKLVLGVAFYGRGWAGVNPEDNGLYQPYTGAAQAYSYAVLAADYIDRNGYVRHWDAAARAPYLWNPATATFITYDDPESLAQKARYVRERGLGGVMYWEHGHDPAETLLDVLHRSLRP